jgi:ribosomal protein L7/L12
VEKLPSSLGEKLSKEDADKVAKKIRDAGGEVEII